MDSRFVRKVFEVSSHQVATGVLHLLQMVELVRVEGRICPHSMQYMVVAVCAKVDDFFGGGLRSDVGKKLPEVAWANSFGELQMGVVRGKKDIEL